MANLLLERIEKRKSGEKIGIYSACTANEYVLEAVMEAGLAHDVPVLIEATANQSNQFGGYTGMTPADFAAFVVSVADKVGFPMDLLILGGDHLGPLTWQNDNEDAALEKSEELVRQYVAAGFTKIHLDTSMRVADDDQEKRLSDEVIARRAVRLASACEKAFHIRKSAFPDAIAPIYVIGSEVPIPGGTQDEEDGVSVTKPDQFLATYETFRSAFLRANLKDAFERVIAVVVQPGVEFGDEQIVEYDRLAAKLLTEKLADFDGLVFEGHSTDYQPKAKLREMVEDGVAILKVGPALTFYFREAVFALADIETELELATPSNFKAVLEAVMLQNPENWEKHYHGTEKELAFKRKYSLSDRARYYFPDPQVQEALSRLISNINGNSIPLSILSQYLPSALERLRNDGLDFTAENLIKARVKDCIDDYLYASKGD